MTRTPSVLVVDDEPGILESLGILLRNAGFDTHTARGGREGLERLGNLQPDIVLSDIRMPDVTGVEILAAARRRSTREPSITSRSRSATTSCSRS
jgi:CheY-like chemotaxis protein